MNYLTGKLDDHATLATAHASRLFLGLQVQCTQCHNHPFNDWKQSQFWQLNSFFRQTVALRRYEPGSNQVRYIELANQDFAGEDRPMEPEQRGSTTNCTGNSKRLFPCSSMARRLVEAVT